MRNANKSLKNPLFRNGVGSAKVTRNPYAGPDMRHWLRGAVVERPSLTGELSVSCARPAADR